MSRRLREVVGLLGFEELIKVREDLNKGGDAVRILIDNRIKEEMKKQNEFCTVCAAKIEPEKPTTFSLEFGPADMRRKVSFCAADCLEYFLAEMKKAIE